MKSRIPAAGAIVGSTMVSAVLALCVLGGVAGGVAAQAPGTAGQTTDLAAATVAPATPANVTTTETPSIESPFAAASAGDVLYGGPATTSTPTSTLSSINSASNSASTASNSVSTATTTGTTASLDVQGGFGLLGGAAADQIPLAAQGASTATVVAAPAKLPIVVTAPVVSKPAAVLPAIAGTPRQMAYAVAVRAGLSAQQWSCLSSLWQQESKFLTTARNSRSGAYGIPQALPASRMASAGADWRTNPVTQIRWGLSYISTRYGTACTAWSHWKRYRWY